MIDNDFIGIFDNVVDEAYCKKNETISLPIATIISRSNYSVITA